ncbi:MAG: tryptophan-rich sensory protein [Saprospiraceae bacterium]|nr:tryptophan-rich sensory protein [Saprospiraceae bacterium]
MRSSIPLLNILFYLGLIAANYFAVQMPFFGKTPGDVSDLYPNLLTPADFAFSIWSVVYILLALFGYQNLKARTNKKEKIPNEIKAIGWLFMLSCILNFAWLLVWQSQHIAWSFIIIFLLWINLILIYYRLSQIKNARWQYSIPFSVYLAWVCVAALANLNILLIDSGFEFFGMEEAYWTATLIGIGILGTYLVLSLSKDIWFTLVLIWAYFGMYVKNKALEPEATAVTSMCLIAFACLIVGGSWAGIKKYYNTPKVV